jgi:hypothetical protein
MSFPGGFDRTLHNQWDRVLESGLPDSRLSGSRRRATTVIRGGMKYEPVFCANCGGSGGMITADWSPHVFFLCDDCFLAGKGQPDAVMADEATIRGT